MQQCVSPVICSQVNRAGPGQYGVEHQGTEAVNSCLSGCVFPVLNWIPK